MKKYVKKILYMIPLFLLIIQIPVGTDIILKASSQTQETSSLKTAYVSPLLYNESFWKYGGYVEDEELMNNISLNKPVKLLNQKDLGRVMIIIDNKVSTSDLKKKVRGLLSVYPLFDKKIVVATISRSDIDVLASTPGVIAIMPDIRLEGFFIKERLIKDLEERDAQKPTQTSGGGGGGLYHYTVNLTKAIDVWTRYGIKGENVKIAIIDTGVDYGSPALGLEAVARDQYGWPLILDADSYGLVLTPVEGNISGTTMYVNTSLLYVYDSWFPAVYREDVGIVYTGCGYDEFDISTWDISNIQYYGKIKFGLAVKNIFYPYGLLWYTLPVILVDSNGDGYYDTMYAAIGLVLYYIAKQLSDCGVYIPNAPTSPSYVFDSGPIRYGNEVISLDLNGDGVSDFSAGTLAGYIYDASWAIIYEKLGLWRKYVQPLPPWWGYYSRPGSFELWSGEPVSLIWPGLDPMGDYVVLAEDFYSHGTFCATTAAGRDFYAYTGYGFRSISGQAPAAKIASSIALWFGDVLTSIYFFSGFDLQTPYGVGSRSLWPVLLYNPWIAFYGDTWNWTYTGSPLVDMTSNSYGVSAWAIWGWASGMDPLSAVFDYTSLVSGVAHFIAAGNGGPGWGTVATPGASSFSITVGAATEFTYRSIYGYLPGGNREVITWSNRGPSELGVSKPDIVAIGAFAWAVGRTWESLNYGVLDGRYSYDLFGGTSQATPMTAGAAALVVSAYKKIYGSNMPAYLLKTVLMNNAYDMGFNDLSQGAGFVDAFKSVTAVLQSSVPKIYSREFVKDILSDMGLSYTSFTYGSSVGAPTWYEPKIYVPNISPGGSVVKTLEVSGSGSLRFYGLKTILISSQSICGAVLSIATPSLVVNCTGDTLYLNMTNRYTGLALLVLDPSKIPKDGIVEIEAVYPFNYFNKGYYGNGRYITWDTYLTWAELWYWIDLNNDGVIQLSETSRIIYDIRGANSVRLQIAKLGDQIREIEDLIKKLYGVDVSGFRKALVLRIGLYYSWINTVVPIKIRINTYGYTTWGEVSISPSTVTFSGTTKVYVIIRAPQTPGFYSGYIIAEDPSRGYRALIPVSYFVPLTLGSSLTMLPAYENTMYKNYYLRGAFDWTWRYESGDWRVFKITVLSGTYAIGVRAVYPTYNKPYYSSNVDSMIFGLLTYYMLDLNTRTIQPYTVSGVQLGGKISAYYIFFWDYPRPGELIYMARTYSPGTYRLVIRNIQFSGFSYEEPFYIYLEPVAYSISLPARIDARYGTNGVITLKSSQSIYLPNLIIPSSWGIYKPSGRDYLSYVYLPNYGINIFINRTTSSPPYYYIYTTIKTDPAKTYNGYYITGYLIRHNASVIAYGITWGSYRFCWCWNYTVLYYGFEIFNGKQP